MLPQKGLERADIWAQLESKKTGDLPWASGRAFAYVYEPPKETKELVADAVRLYLSENALDPTSFPSLLQLETEVVGMVANLLNGATAVGNFTSGGTESIILALKTARDYMREVRGIERGEVIVCETAHAAFHKACYYLGLKIVVVPMREDFTMSMQHLRANLTDSTIMLVGSSPNYSHGVIDPIEELAALAKERGILCHVDACVGGFYLPFARLAGEQIPPFDFSVEGVTSMSCDLHKYGYTAKGASVILHRDAELRKYQIFTCSDWTGYSIINPTVLSSKSGGTLAGAWAALHHLGVEGYTNMARTTQAATRQFVEGIGQIEALEVLGAPVMNLVAVRSKKPEVSVFALSDMMKKRGWYLQLQLASERSPEALHLNINHANAPWVADLLKDLAEAVRVLEAAAEVLPTFPLEMLLEMLSGGIDAAAGAFGMGEDGALPEDFAVINNVLNQLPNEWRNRILTEFVNRMYV